MDSNSQNTQLYSNLNASSEPIVMESMCVKCQENGETVMMMTKIPMFKEVILISFYCEHCGYKNSEVTFGGKLNDYASRISLKVIKVDDFKRDCVRSEHCKVSIPEFEFEMPASKKGSVNTIEGFLVNAVDDLTSDQEERKVKAPELYQKIERVIQKLQDCIDGKSFPFTFIFDDPSGNSFIKNPYAPNQDHNMIIQKIPRTLEQLKKMGYSIDNAIEQSTEKSKSETQSGRFQTLDAHRLDFNKPLTEDVQGESLVFNIQCHTCGLEGDQKMCTTSVPYFKELIIMSFLCSFCGNKSTEVKAGGEVSALGKEIVLEIATEDDIRRDLFKSETCSLRIPDIDFELDFGTLGGVYTTVEGLFEKIEENLKEFNPFQGDSDSFYRRKMNELFSYLQKVRNLEIKDCVIILRDLMDNSFIMNPYYPEKDPRVKVSTFERTHEENDILGLNDMKVENYGENTANL